MPQNSDSLKPQPRLPQDSIQSGTPAAAPAEVNRSTMDSVQEAPVRKATAATETITPVQSTTSPAVSPKTKLYKHRLNKQEVDAPSAFYLFPDTSPADTIPVRNTEVTFLAEPALRPKQTSAWEIGILLLCVALIAGVKAFNKRRFGMLTKAFFNNRVIPQYLREENAFFNQVVLVLTFVFILVAATMAYQAVNFWMPGEDLVHFRFFARACLFIVLVYILKFAVLELISEVIDQHQAIQEYLFNVVLFNGFIGISLLPCIIFSALTLRFTGIFLAMGVALIVITYLYRNWRAIKISSGYQFPVYYIFLYLCTLEILPSVILIKLLRAQLI